MNVLALLERQNEEAITLLRTLEAVSAGHEREKRLQQLQTALEAHIVSEEELFYTSVTAGRGGGTLGLAVDIEDVKDARDQLQRCMGAMTDDHAFSVRLTVLKNLIEQHIEEERARILPLASRVIPETELVALGARLEALFARAA